jgi:hypothetical protein
MATLASVGALCPVTTSALLMVAKTALAEEAIRTTTRHLTTMSTMEFRLWQTAKAYAWKLQIVTALNITAMAGVKYGFVQRELKLVSSCLATLAFAEP